MAAGQQHIDYGALVKHDRVHGRAYTDTDIFEEEMAKIFHRGWVYVGHAGEIPNPGDFRLTKIGRQPVIMVRDDDSQIQLFMNRCSHRANAVCQTERGNKTAFRCAYHGWTFRRNGELASVPYQDGYGASFRKEDFGLRKVPRMDLSRGFVFGSLSPAGITLDEHLGKAKEQIDLFVDQSPEGELEVRSGIHKYGYKANWKFQLENAMDGYHPNFVHQAFLRSIQKRTGIKVDTFSGDSIGLTRDFGNGNVMLDYRPNNAANREKMMAVLPTTAGGKAYEEALIARYGQERAEEILIAGGTHLLVFPNLILIGVQIRVVQPLSVDQTEVFLYPTLLKGVPQEMNIKRLRGHESFYGPAGSGAPDDLEMFERNQVGLSAEVDPWLLLARGLHRERRDADGTIIGHMTDEVTQRGIWRHWKKVMTQSAGIAGNQQLRASGGA